MRPINCRSIIKLAIVSLLVAAVIPTGVAFAAKDKELNVWTWGIFCPETASKSFQEKYGIKVNCTFYHGNEELWSKLQAGHAGVDIIEPTNFLIRRLYDAGLIGPIDVSRIPNYENLLDAYKNVSYNKFNGKVYSVPHVFGLNAVCYRRDLVAEPPTSWEALWDERYEGHIGFSRDSNDATFVVGIMLGMDISKLDEDTDTKLAAIKERWQKQNPLLLKRYQSLQELKNLLAAGDLWITTTADGTCRKLKFDGFPVELVVPNEGTPAWSDEFCILTDAPHKEAAHLWVDHMLSPEMASEIIKKFMLMAVNKAAIEALPEDLRKIMTYTDAEMKRFVPYPTLKPETSEKMTKAYQDVLGE